ncbi:MAG: DNA-binding response regulator [Thermoanaerobaculia bacterium]
MDQRHGLTADLSASTGRLPTRRGSNTLDAVQRPSPSRRTEVCFYSFHPLVRMEVQRQLEESGMRVKFLTIDAADQGEARRGAETASAIFLIDAHPRRSVTEALARDLLARHPRARLLVMAESLEESTTFPLLRIGAKGLLTYDDVSTQLARAVREVASGGYWVPRSLLSSFVKTVLSASPPARLLDSAPELTRREREVLERLLDNLSNKEIARDLKMSERTAKFHVSNLLAKFGVKRRADLILLNFSRPTG